MSFPATTKFEEWFKDPATGDEVLPPDFASPGGEWLKAVLIQTGGIGIGAGVGLQIVLFVSLMVYCCCRTTCCKRNRCCKPCCFVHYYPARSEDRSTKLKLLLAYAICFITCLACTAVIASGAAKGVDALDKGFEGAKSFVDNAQDFTCSSTIDLAAAKGCSAAASDLRRNECKIDSMDQFLVGGRDLVVGVLDFTVALAGSLTSSISTSLGEASTAADGLKVNIDSMSTLLDNIKNSADSLRSQASEMTNPTTGEQVVNPSTIPDVSANLAGVNDAKAELDSSLTGINTAKEGLDSATAELETSLKDNVESMRTKLDDSLCDMSDNMIENSEQLRPAKADIAELQEDVAGLKQTVMAAFAVIPVFAAVVPFALGCCGAMLNGTRAAKCSCVIIFLLIFEFCFITGLSQVISIVMGDVCDNLEVLITTNVNMTLNLTDIGTMDPGKEIVHVGSSAVEILQCGGAQTFVGILGIESLFNRSSDVATALSSVDEVLNGTQSSTSSLTSGIDELAKAKKEFDQDVGGSGGAEYNESAIPAELEKTRQQCEALDGSIPAVAAQKTACLLNISVMNTTVQEMNANISLLYAAKSNTSSEVDALLTALNNTGTSIQNLTDSTEKIKTKLDEVVDYVMQAPSRTGCAFVGVAYSQIVEQALCTDVHGSFKSIYMACGFTIAVMVVGWYFVLVPWIQKTYGDLDDKLDGIQMGAMDSSETNNPASANSNYVSAQGPNTFI